MKGSAAYCSSCIMPHGLLLKHLAASYGVCARRCGSMPSTHQRRFDVLVLNALAFDVFVFTVVVGLVCLSCSRMPSSSRVISLFLYKLPILFLNAFLLTPKRSAIFFGWLLSVTVINPSCCSLSIIFLDRVSMAL